MLEDTENKCLVHVAFLQGNYYRKSISTFVTFFRSAVKVISSFFIDRQRSGKNHHKNTFYVNFNTVTQTRFSITPNP